MQQIKMCCHNIDVLNIAFPDIVFPKKRISNKLSQGLLPMILLMVEQWLKLRIRIVMSNLGQVFP